MSKKIKKWGKFLAQLVEAQPKKVHAVLVKISNEGYRISSYATYLIDCDYRTWEQVGIAIRCNTCDIASDKITLRLCTRKEYLRVCRRHPHFRM